MPKYHYNVHVLASNGNDFSMWVGVTLDHKCDPSDHCCPNGSDLGKAAIARASELCPSVIGWDCEEWNGGDEVEDPVQKFLGADYKNKMAILKAAIKPLLTALDETHMQLAVDHRGEYWLTAIPWRDEYAGGMPDGMDTGKLLDATMALGDARHLVAVID